MHQPTENITKDDADHVSEISSSNSPVQEKGITKEENKLGKLDNAHLTSALNVLDSTVQETCITMIDSDIISVPKKTSICGAIEHVKENKLGKIDDPHLTSALNVLDSTVQETSITMIDSDVISVPKKTSICGAIEHVKENKLGKVDDPHLTSALNVLDSTVQETSITMIDSDVMSVPKKCISEAPQNTLKTGAVSEKIQCVIDESGKRGPTFSMIVSTINKETKVKPSKVRSSLRKMVSDENVKIDSKGEKQRFLAENPPKHYKPPGTLSDDEEYADEPSKSFFQDMVSVENVKIGSKGEKEHFLVEKPPKYYKPPGNLSEEEDQDEDDAYEPLKKKKYSR